MNATPNRAPRWFGYTVVALTATTFGVLALYLSLRGELTIAEAYKATAVTTVVAFVAGLLLWAASRRRFQYSLRTLLIVVFLASVGMSFIAVRIQRVQRQKTAVATIRANGGSTWYDYQKGEGVSEPPGPAWLRDRFGIDWVADVVGASVTSDKNMEPVGGLLRLKALHACGRGISDAGLKHIEGLKRLETLVLSDTGISDTGLQSLKGLTELRYLGLEGTRITGEGLENLQGLTRLRGLDLRRTRLTKVGVTRIARLSRLESLTAPKRKHHG